mmetsp:Transcript_2977/g.8390  ORF Transcript_2977/g.8390 Transcript_2977/m.8390 type:complete len:205 (+) Transcript_2977:351-965(+)
MVALAVYLGTGMRTATLSAKSFELKVDFTLTLHSMRVRPYSLMMGMTLKGRLMPSWQRYLSSSNSPSGGTKLTTLSVLKRPRLTQGWKVMELSSSLSLSPSLRSGMPERKHFIRIWPTTSQRSTLPLLDMSRLTFSTTSKNTSFFLYLMPSLLQPTAPVTWRVAFLACSSLLSPFPPLRAAEAEVRKPSWKMYCFRIMGSRTCG